MPDFETQSYWHERFTSETSFEWLISSSRFMSLLQPHLSRLNPTEARILHLGSGTSDLQNHFRASGFSLVVNLDFEPLAAERGRRLEEQAFGDAQMRYVTGDLTQQEKVDEHGNTIKREDWWRWLREQEGLFDMVIDKSTADAISCGGDEALRRMARTVRECMKEGALWVSLSYSTERFDDVVGLPFDVESAEKVALPKKKETDPEICHWCYVLRPR